MEDVAVLDDILLAFEPHLAGVLGTLLTLAGDEIRIGDGFGADEALLEIGVDDAGRFRRAAAGAQGPGMRLLGADGEEGEEAEQAVAGADDAVEPRLRETERG